MYCKHCGSPLEDESKFCPGCGQSLENNVPREAEEIQPPEVDAEEIKTPEVNMEIPSEIPQEIATNTFGESVTEPQNTEENTAKEEASLPESTPFDPQNTFTPPVAPHTPGDPFSGPAHPSVKRNIIISCVALFVATVISIILMCVGIVNLVATATENEKVFPGTTEKPTYSTTTEGNTSSNIFNFGFAVSDGGDGIYYADANQIYHYSDTDGAEFLYDSDGTFFGLNYANNCLYYLDEWDYLTFVCKYDLYSGTETILTDFEETFYYCCLYQDEFYIASDYRIYAVDVNSEENWRTVYESEDEIMNMYVCDEGIYISLYGEDGNPLYRTDHNGEDMTFIADGYNFVFDNGNLYIDDLDEQGYNAIYVADMEGNVQETLYTFDTYGTYINIFAVADDMAYCVTETYDETATYELITIDLTSGETHLIDSNSTEDSNPFFGLNIVDDQLFYYDLTYTYGIHRYDVGNF